MISSFAGCYRHSPKGWQGKKHELPVPANFVCSCWILDLVTNFCATKFKCYIGKIVCRRPRLGGGVLVMTPHHDHDDNSSKTTMLPQLIFMEPCLWTGISAFWVSQILRALLWHKQIIYFKKRAELRLMITHLHPNFNTKSYHINIISARFQWWW